MQFLMLYETLGRRYSWLLTRTDITLFVVEQKGEQDLFVKISRFFSGEISPFQQLIEFIIIIIITLLTSIELSIGGSSPYTSTNKTNMNKCT